MAVGFALTNSRVPKEITQTACRLGAVEIADESLGLHGGKPTRDEWKSNFLENPLWSSSLPFPEWACICADTWTIP